MPRKTRTKARKKKTTTGAKNRYISSYTRNPYTIRAGGIVRGHTRDTRKIKRRK